MSDGADLTFDAAKIERDADRVVRQHLTAGTNAVAKSTERLERSLEAAAQGAIPGKLWKAFASKSRPASGPARNPAGTVFLNGRDRTHGALAFWTEPGQVRGKTGQWLAIPTPAAGSRGRLRNLTPGEWERRTGQRLRFIYRPGKPGLLVADGGTVVGRQGAYKPYRALTRGRTAADEKRGFSVVM